MIDERGRQDERPKTRGESGRAAARGPGSRKDTARAAAA